MEKTDNSISSDLIESKEDLLSTYKELFVKEIVDESEYHIEIPTSDEPDVFRFIITPSGFVGISSLDKERVWEIDVTQDEDKRLLTKLDKVVEENVDSHDLRNLVREFRSDNETYFIRILPYSERRATGVLRCVLDERLERVK